MPLAAVGLKQGDVGRTEGAGGKLGWHPWVPCWPRGCDLRSLCPCVGEDGRGTGTFSALWVLGAPKGWGRRGWGRRALRCPSAGAGPDPPLIKPTPGVLPPRRTPRGPPQAQGEEESRTGGSAQLYFADSSAHPAANPNHLLQAPRGAEAGDEADDDDEDEDDEEEEEGAQRGTTGGTGGTPPPHPQPLLGPVNGHGAAEDVGGGAQDGAVSQGLSTSLPLALRRHSGSSGHPWPPWPGGKACHKPSGALPRCPGCGHEAGLTWRRWKTSVTASSPGRLSSSTRVMKHTRCSQDL